MARRRPILFARMLVRRVCRERRLPSIEHLRLRPSCRVVSSSHRTFHSRASYYSCFSSDGLRFHYGVFIGSPHHPLSFLSHDGRLAGWEGNRKTDTRHSRTPECRPGIINSSRVLTECVRLVRRAPQTEKTKLLRLCNVMYICARLFYKGTACSPTQQRACALPTHLHPPPNLGVLAPETIQKPKHQKTRKAKRID